MSEPNNKQEQQKLVKARKAARVVFWFIVFGGSVLFLYGILTAFLPTVLDGVTMMVSSLLPLVLSKKIERKLDKLMV